MIIEAFNYYNIPFNKKYNFLGINYNYCITLANLLQKLLDFFQNILIPKEDQNPPRKTNYSNK